MSAPVFHLPPAAGRRTLEFESLISFRPSELIRFSLDPGLTRLREKRLPSRGACVVVFLPPLRGLFIFHCFTTAYAVGFILAPLRGWAYPHSSTEWFVGALRARRVPARRLPGS